MLFICLKVYLLNSFKTFNKSKQNPSISQTPKTKPVTIRHKKIRPAFRRWDGYCPGISLMFIRPWILRIGPERPVRRRIDRSGRCSRC
jgi:hypothetical protein